LNVCCEERKKEDNNGEGRREERRERSVTEKNYIENDRVTGVKVAKGGGLGGRCETTAHDRHLGGQRLRRNRLGIDDQIVLLDKHVQYI